MLGWGTTSTTRSPGLGRVRYTGAPSTLAARSRADGQGRAAALRQRRSIAKKAANPVNYSVTSWHYVRTYKYGSPQLKADGTPGTDRLDPSRAYVSKDGHSVFVAVPGMKPVMQMRVGWSLASAAGTAFQDSASFTPYELTKFDPEAKASARWTST